MANRNTEFSVIRTLKPEYLEMVTSSENVSVLVLELDNILNMELSETQFSMFCEISSELHAIANSLLDNSEFSELILELIDYGYRTLKLRNRTEHGSLKLL